MNTTQVPQEIESLEKNIIHMQQDLEEMNKKILLLKHSSTIRKRKVLHADQKLVSLLGTQPMRSLHQDKILIREAIGQHYRK